MHRRAIVLGAAAAAGATTLAAFDTNAAEGDNSYFLESGRGLLSREWLETFADPGLQAGPLQLLGFGAIDGAAGVVGVEPLTLLPFVVHLAAAAAVYVTVRRLVGDEGRGALPALAALAAVALGLTHLAYVDGHPGQLFIPLLWILAGADARARRPARAGALVGLSACLETWGMLGVAVLGCAPTLRTAVRGVVVQTAVAVAAFAPFVAAGSFRMLEHEWITANGTLAGALIGVDQPFGWELRLVQGAVAVAVGGGIAWRLRRPEAVWLVPFAVTAIRVTLDPLNYPWYLLAPETAALVGLVHFAGIRAPELLGRARLRRTTNRNPSPAFGRSAGGLFPTTRDVAARVQRKGE